MAEAKQNDSGDTGAVGENQTVVDGTNETGIPERPLNARDVSQAQEFKQNLSNLIAALKIKVVTNQRKLALEALEAAVKFLAEELANYGEQPSEETPSETPGA